MSTKTKHPQIKLAESMTLGEAFEVMAFNCISQLETSASVLAKNYDIEALHQMRVGLRRFDALLELYKDLVDIPYELKIELKWLNRQLSLVRDHDVLIHSTLPMINNKQIEVTNDANAKLTQHLADYLQVEGSHQQIIELIRSRRYINFYKRLAEYFLAAGWLQTLSAKSRRRITQEIRLIAPVKLKKQRKVLIEFYKHIDIKQQRSIHQIRIASKRLRYSAELLQSLYPQKKVSAYIKKLIRLQDCLGLLNDIKVANKLLKKMNDVDKDLLKEKKRFKRSLKTHLKDKQQQVDGVWASFKLASPFWESSS